MIVAARRSALLLLAALVATFALCALGFVPQFVPRSGGSHLAVTPRAQQQGLPRAPPRAARMR